MMEYDLIFITTCCNHDYIFKQIDGVLKYNNNLSLCLILVNQSAERITNINSTPNTEVIVIEHARMVNTSIARNIGIDYVLNNKIRSHFVAFPDDDSSFDEAFFNVINDLIVTKQIKNFVTDIYCTGTKKLFRYIKYIDGTSLTKYDFNIVGAVNIIVTYETFLRNSYFDMRFGVNAKYGAGEDGDYFIRAVQISPFFYKKNLYSFHPSGEDKYKRLSFAQIRNRLFNYGQGGIALLCKHKMYFQAVILAFRALGGGLNYLRKLKIKIAICYFEAFFIRMFYLIKFTISPIQ